MPTTGQPSPNLESTTNTLLDEYLKTANAQRLIDWANSEYGKAKTARLPIQRQWYLNMSMFFGRQWVEILQTNGKLMTPRAPRHRVRMTVNRIRPLVRTEIARLTSQKPNASVVPASSEDEDLYAAMAGEAVWNSLSQRNGYNTVLSRMAWWLTICGTGFIKTYWDPTKGDPNNPDTAGEICWENVTPFHLFVPDLREQEIENQPWVMNVYTKPVQWAKTYFPVLKDKDLQPSIVSANEILEDAYLNLSGGTNNNAPDSVLVKEVWAKPGAHPDLPRGGWFVLVDNHLVEFYDMGMPYGEEFPFAKFEHVPSGKFYADSVITDVIPLQREYNRTRSQIIEAKNRTSKPQLLAPKGSVDPAKITSEAGLVIEYRPGLNPPQPMPLTQLPPYVLQELDRTLMDIEDISGQHQVSKGNTPPGVTAATAISFLQEKDDSYLTHTYQSIEVGTEKVARQTLGLAVKYWDVPRLVRTVGSDGAFDTLLLAGSDIAKGTDIRIEGGSSLPTSKAARQALIMDLMKMGFIDPNEGLKYVGIGGLEKLYDKLRIDENQARRENLRFKRLTEQEILTGEQQFQQAQMQGDPATIDAQTGEPLAPPPVVPVNSWDNHAVHIQTHNDFRKSQAFELLPEPVKAQMETHVNLHVQMLMMSQMPMPGEPGMEESMPGEPPADEGAPPMEGP